MMKYLKYLIFGLLLLAILFISIGLFKPSVSYSSEFEVEKPLNEAWAVMNDDTKLSEWLSDIKEMEVVKGEKGQVGAVTRYVFVQDGEESEIIETIRAIEDQEFVEMDFAMEGVMNMDYRVDFSERAGKTVIKSSTTAKGDGVFMRSLLPLINSSLKKEEDSNMDKLKKLIEENTTDYFMVPQDSLSAQ